MRYRLKDNWEVMIYGRYFLLLDNEVISVILEWKDKYICDYKGNKFIVDELPLEIMDRIPERIKT